MSIRTTSRETKRKVTSTGCRRTKHPLWVSMLRRRPSAATTCYGSTPTWSAATPPASWCAASPTPSSTVTDSSRCRCRPPRSRRPRSPRSCCPQLLPRSANPLRRGLRRADVYIVTYELLHHRIDQFADVQRGWPPPTPTETTPPSCCHGRWRCTAGWRPSSPASRRGTPVLFPHRRVPSTPLACWRKRSWWGRPRGAHRSRRGPRWAAARGEGRRYTGPVEAALCAPGRNSRRAVEPLREIGH